MFIRLGASLTSFFYSRAFVWFGRFSRASLFLFARLITYETPFYHVLLLVSIHEFSTRSILIAYITRLFMSSCINTTARIVFGHWPVREINIENSFTARRHRNGAGQVSRQRVQFLSTVRYAKRTRTLSISRNGQRRDIHVYIYMYVRVMYCWGSTNDRNTSGK